MSRVPGNTDAQSASATLVPGTKTTASAVIRVSRITLTAVSCIEGQGESARRWLTGSPFAKA